MAVAFMDVMMPRCHALLELSEGHFVRCVHPHYAPHDTHAHGKLRWTRALVPQIYIAAVCVGDMADWEKNNLVDAVEKKLQYPSDP